MVESCCRDTLYVSIVYAFVVIFGGAIGTIWFYLFAKYARETHPIGRRWRSISKGSDSGSGRPLAEPRKKGHGECDCSHHSDDSEESEASDDDRDDESEEDRGDSGEEDRENSEAGDCEDADAGDCEDADAGDREDSDAGDHEDSDAGDREGPDAGDREDTNADAREGPEGNKDREYSKEAKSEASYRDSADSGEDGIDITGDNAEAQGWPGAGPKFQEERGENASRKFSKRAARDIATVRALKKSKRTGMEKSTPHSPQGGDRALRRYKQRQHFRAAPGRQTQGESPLPGVGEMPRSSGDQPNPAAAPLGAAVPRPSGGERGPTGPEDCHGGGRDPQSPDPAQGEMTATLLTNLLGRKAAEIIAPLSTGTPEEAQLFASLTSELGNIFEKFVMSLDSTQMSDKNKIELGKAVGLIPSLLKEGLNTAPHSEKVLAALDGARDEKRQPC